MSRAFRYTVRCELPDEALADRYFAWLLDEGHIAEVLATSGARGAEVLRLDGTPPRVEVRYDFASRADFERYERDHAARLRAAAAPFARAGARWERTTGVLVHARTRS